MEEKVTILNVNKFEKDGKVKSRIGFIFAEKDKIGDTDSFNGLSEISIYYDNADVFNNLPVDVIGVVCIATIDSVPNKSNPLKDKKLITKLRLSNGKSYNLV